VQRGRSRLLGGHARRFNERHDLEGHLWQARYFDSIVENESYLLTAGMYVVLNSVRAGVCDHPRSFRWCSYQETAHGEPVRPFRPDLLLAAIDTDPERARQRYLAIVDLDAALLVSTRGREAAAQVPG
jgi:putative transposase